MAFAEVWCHVKELVSCAWIPLVSNAVPVRNALSLGICFRSAYADSIQHLRKATDSLKFQFSTYSTILTLTQISLVLYQLTETE